MIEGNSNHAKSLKTHYHDREETMNRNIKLCQRRISDVAGALNLRHGNLVDQANFYINKIERQGLLTNKPLEAKVALVLYISARVNKKAKCLSEILHYTSASNRQVNSCLKKTMKTIFKGVDLRR